MNIATANVMQTHLKGMGNVPRILKQMKSGKAKLGEWQGLVKVGVESATIGQH